MNNPRTFLLIFRPISYLNDCCFRGSMESILAPIFKDLAIEFERQTGVNPISAEGFDAFLRFIALHTK